MATVPRSAKSASQWTPSELTAFNIEIIRQDSSSFFNLQQLPIPKNISPVIWNNDTAPPGAQLSKVEQHFFDYVKEGTRIPREDRSLVKDFVVFLLGMLDYDTGHRIVRTRNDMPFYVCGSRVSAKVDVTVMECEPRVQYILIVQEDMTFRTGHEPEARLVAEAIAAFYQNNWIRRGAGLPPLESQMFPAIAMAGTAPVFYKITITQDLLFAVETGQYPANATIVHQLRPVFGMDYIRKGMAPLENRRIALKCFEAFKQFMVLP